MLSFDEGKKAVVFARKVVDLYVKEKLIEPDREPKIIKINRETKEAYEDTGQ